MLLLDKYPLKTTYANKALRDCMTAVPIKILSGKSMSVTPILLIKPVLTTPVGATGENAPAFAPVATIMAISRGLIFDLADNCIATGAIKRVAAILPGPIADKINDKKKIETGSSFVFPPILDIKESVNFESVPLVEAIPKNSVIPTSIRNRFDGKRLVTSFSFIPRTIIPMINAKTILTTPIFTFGRKIPMRIASSNAEREIIAVNIVR